MQHVRRLVVSVGEVEVQDNVPSSDVKTFMCYDRDRPRETGSSMLAVQMECVRPDRAAKPEAEEWRLKVRSLPLRLYIDQDALEFLVQYFSAMEGSPVIPEGEPLYFRTTHPTPPARLTRDLTELGVLCRKLRGEERSSEGGLPAQTTRLQRPLR
jgi:hypothetical protein